MKKITALIIAVLAVLVFFSGCAEKAGREETVKADAVQEQTKADGEKKEETAAEDKTEAGFPLTVKDANGFETILEKKPESIVSLTLGTDEMLLSLVDKSRIRALTIYADDPGISNIAGEVQDIPEKVVSEAERIISLKPDLVFTDTWAKAEFVKQLRDAKIAVYVFKTPSNIEEQRKTVAEIAHVVGEDEKGAKIVAWMDEKLKGVDERLKQLKPEERLRAMDYGEMGSSGKGTNFDDIIRRAGLVNVVAEAGLDGWPNLSKEKIIEFDPDIIIVPSWYYDKNNTQESFTKAIKEDKALSSVKAVKSNRILALPNPHISAISQYVVLGVEDLAKAAYPEFFK
jgi:iron complex transport system substrate-binding protein